jgi:chemotaxis protein MotB
MKSFLLRAAPETMEENPLWLIVLCDMMTNLMLFFLVMFVVTLQGPQVQKNFAQVFDTKGTVDPDAAKIDAALQEINENEAVENILAALHTAGLRDAVEVTETRDLIRVRLRDAVLFQQARGNLDPEAARTIGLLAQVLTEMDNEIIVEGHTDSVPISRSPYRSNWELSVARAHAVVERLIAGGIAPKRLVTAGYGEFRPLADNATTVGRGQNRRVEIVILRHPEEGA